MAEHEHERRRTEQRRAEGTAERRYGQGSRQTGGRQESPNPRQGGQTDQWSGRSSPEYSDQQSTEQFSGGQSGQQSSHQRGQQFQQTGEGTGQQSGEHMGQRTGGRTGKQPSGQTSRQADPQIGPQTGGRQMGQQTAQSSGQQPQRQAPIRPVTVRDVAATDVVTAQPDAPVSDVVQKMASENVGAVVIVHENRPVGIVTDRKITLALRETSDVSRMQASDLMTEDPFTVSEDTSVFELARQLGGKGVRRVPVVDDQGDLQGIVSLDDAIVLLAEEFYNLSQIIRKQSSRF